MSVFSVRGLPASVLTAGASSQEAASVLLLHGAGANAEIWRPMLEKAPEGLHVVAPSLPGRLGSEGAPLASVGEMAAWVAELCRAMGLERVVAVGHSLGGGVAIELACGVWDDLSVDGLVLVSTGARLRVHPMILAWAEQVAEGADYDPTGMLPFVDDPTGALAAAYGAAVRQTPGATMLADWRAANGFDRLGVTFDYPGPVRVLVGEEDRLTPVKYGQSLVAAFEGAELQTLAGAGHMLPFERPEAFMGAWV